MKVQELMENDIDYLFRIQKSRTHELEIYIDRLLSKHTWLYRFYWFKSAAKWWSTNVRDMKTLDRAIDQDLSSILPAQEFRILKHKYNQVLQAKQKYEAAGGNLFPGNF